MPAIPSSGRFLAVFCIALLAGIYLGDAVGVRHARDLISPAAFVEMQQAIHGRFVRLMPPLILLALAGHLVWLWSLRTEVRALPFWLVLASVAGIVAMALLTRLISMPLNQQLMTWTSTAPPTDLRPLWRPWEEVNRIRLVIALCALAGELWLLNRSLP